ncbi:hypothetical protein B0H14DRAFT_2594628 [Mycena olivaceomarginata]|nr:hypothetical protein B0H14DRAFT_2594628 [Mycena olivaceomarginata]
MKCLHFPKEICGNDGDPSGVGCVFLSSTIITALHSIQARQHNVEHSPLLFWVEIAKERPAWQRVMALMGGRVTDGKTPMMAIISKILNSTDLLSHLLYNHIYELSLITLLRDIIYLSRGNYRALVGGTGLVEAALNACDYIEGFRHAPQEQQKLLSEMDNLRLLLIDLQIRIRGNPSKANLQKMNSPLADFKATMEEFIEKLKPANGRLLRFWKRIKWALGNKKEANEYLVKFQQFESKLHTWLSLDIWDMIQQNGIEQAG